MSDEHPSAVLFAKLRNETCKLLGYNADNLSALEGLRVDLVCSLRLEVDRQQSLQLAGQAADLRVLTSATEALENLLKPAFVTAFDCERQNAIARAELSRIISGVLQFKLRVAGETLQREEQAAAQAAAGGGSTIEYIPPPKRVAAPVLSDNVRHADYIDAAVLDEPPPPAPPPEPSPRHSSAFNPNSAPSPRSPKPTEVSSTYSASADWEARRGSSLRRFDIPKDF